jgi:hypothetical protein
MIQERTEQDRWCLGPAWLAGVPANHGTRWRNHEKQENEPEIEISCSILVFLMYFVVDREFLVDCEFPTGEDSNRRGVESAFLLFSVFSVFSCATFSLTRQPLGPIGCIYS